jgi:hypothetical protein
LLTTGAPAGRATHAAASQPGHRQAAQLADARLAHADHLADLGERQLFFVVERQDLPLALRQLADGLRQARRSSCRSIVCTADSPGSTQNSSSGVPSAVGRRAPRRGQLQRAELFERALVLQHGHAQGRRNLPLLGLAAEARPLRGHGAVHVAAQAAQRARRPVEVAQGVEHRAVDAAARERLERHPQAGLVAAGGFDEAEHAGAHEIFDLHLRRQALGETLRQALHQRHVLHHQLVARFDTSRLGAHAHCVTSSCSMRPPARRRPPCAGPRPASRDATMR